MAFSADGKILATTGGDRPSRLTLWEVATGKELMGLEGPDVLIQCLAFSPDGKRLACGMQNSTALIWDLTASSRK
jgi:WD40 repeat protein